MLGMIPGMERQLRDVEIDDRQIYRTEAIILSMTPAEREKPDLINPSRKRLIAAGCGMKVEDVNRLLKQYEQMKQMMKQLGKAGKKGKRRRGMNMAGLEKMLPPDFKL
jgi:signal recognition particle subunit SRP54